MKYFISIFIILFLCTGCSNKYKDQLEYYQSTIGNKCMYYLDKDEKLSQDKKDFYYQINKDTTKLLTSGGK